jgi:WD40 repeat protein
MSDMTSIASFVDTIARNRLLDAAQMDKLTRQLQYRFADPQSLAQDLVRRGWVTPQQIYPLLQNGAGQPLTYSERKAASRHRWLVFNIIGGLLVVVLPGIIYFGLKQDRLRARDRAEAVRLSALDEQARAELKPLEEAAEHFTMDDEQLRKNLLAFRVRYCEVPAALRAAELLAQLPSPLDGLSHGGIPKDAIEKGQPENLVAVLGERRWRHWGPIRAVALQGDTVASAGDDNVVRVWEKKSGKELAALPVANALALNFLSGGKMLACATPDGNISLWEIATGKKYGDYQGPVSNVVAVALTRDGLVAASVQQDGLAKVWELETGKELGTLRGHNGAVNCVAFAPDGYTIATGGADGQVRLWTQSGDLKATPLAEHTDGVRSVAFSPDGKLLASGGAERDCNVILWDIAKGESIVTMEGHQQPVTGLAFTADQKRIVSASADETMRLWEVLLKEEKKPAAPQPNPDNQNQANNANQNADAATDPNAPKPPPLPQPPPKPKWAQLAGHAGPVLAVAVAGEGDGETIASAGADGTVRLWSVSKRNEITSIGDHRGPVSSVVFVDDGRFLASGGLDKTVKIWNVTSGTLRNGYAHAATVTALSYSAADKIIASGSSDGAVKLFDAGMNKEVNKDLGTLTGHLGPIVSLAFSLDGKTLAVGAASADFRAGQLKLWNPATRNERGTLLGHQDVVSAVAFTPDGRTLASASYDGTVRFTEPYLGLPRGVIDPKGDRIAMIALAVAPDGKSAAVASYNRTVQIWDIASHEERKTHPGQSGVCKGLAYSPDGKLLASAQQDGKLIVWNAAGGDKKEWQFPGAVNSVAFAPDSRHLATANANGTVYVLRLAEPPVRRKR